MAEFVDGNGKKHTAKIRNLGHLSEIEERHGLSLDKVFMQTDGMELALLLWGDLRRLAAIIADLCGITGDDLKPFVNAMDDEAIERARFALMESLADFCLPPAKRGQMKSQIPTILSMSQEVGLNKDSESAEPSV